MAQICRSQSGGPERDRTADLLNANQALSQLSYRPRGVDYRIRLCSGLETRAFQRTKPCANGGPKWNCTTDPRVISTVLC